MTLSLHSTLTRSHPRGQLLARSCPVVDHLTLEDFVAPTMSNLANQVGNWLRSIVAHHAPCQVATLEGDTGDPFARATLTTQGNMALRISRSQNSSSIECVATLAVGQLSIFTLTTTTLVARVPRVALASVAGYAQHATPPLDYSKRTGLGYLASPNISMPDDARRPRTNAGSSRVDCL